MSRVLTWTDARLARLYERYRSRYWPTSRRLRAFSIRAAALDAAYGECDYATKTLLIDVRAHTSDRELRATVLHEMIHAVLGTSGHNSPFWEELEYLLSRKAPITVGFPELGEQGNQFCVIPNRFRRCRRLFGPVYKRQQREIEKLAANPDTLTPAMIETQAEDAAVEGLEWRPLWSYMARVNGFVDLDGRTLPWAEKYRAAARRGFIRGRRFHLENERAHARFQELMAEERQ